MSSIPTDVTPYLVFGDLLLAGISRNQLVTDPDTKKQFWEFRLKPTPSTKEAYGIQEKDYDLNLPYITKRIPSHYVFLINADTAHTRFFTVVNWEGELVPNWSKRYQEQVNVKCQHCLKETEAIISSHNSLINEELLETVAIKDNLLISLKGALAHMQQTFDEYVKNPAALEEVIKKKLEDMLKLLLPVNEQQTTNRGNIQ